jgi:3-hydroxybutyryl-CoA dehydrogenase
MFRIDPRRSYMMPAHFGPTYMGSKTSGWYRDVTMMVVPYLTDRDQLAALLPEHFDVGEEPLITVFYARNRDVDWLAGNGYNMISVSASVVFNSDRGPLAGSYTLVIWENLTDPILAGRELQGIPKVFADIPDHTVADGTWHCTASHFGHRIVDLRVSQLRAPTAEEMAADAAAREGKDNPMGWRFLPGIGGFGTALSETTLFPSETVFTEVQVGEGAIDWNRLTWEQNPTQYHIVNALAELPVLEYRPAAVTSGSANLVVPGRMSRVLHGPASGQEPAAAVATSTISEFHKVCFVGAGTMGCFNALVAALSGYRAVLYDANPDALQRVPSTQQGMAAFLVGSGYCLPADLPEAFERISTTGDLAEAVADAGLVSESVFEDLALKREIHAELDRLCEPTTILTTNTSALLVSDIEDAVGHGERFAALHSHLGAPLVDIVGGPRTSAATIELLERYVRSLRGIPMVLEKEHKGYVFNAMMGPLLTTALMLVVEGLATREEVDRAWMVNRKAPMGPFGMMDLFGLNVVHDSWRGENPDSALGPVRAKILPYLAPWVERGDLGMKTGRGFYRYPKPAYAEPGFLEGEPADSAPHLAMTLALVQSAVLLASKGIAAPEEIDRSWMAATTLDAGPFGILDAMGIDTFLAVSNASPSLLAPVDLDRVRDFLQAQVEREALGEKTGEGFYSYPDPAYRASDFVQGSAA